MIQSQREAGYRAGELKSRAWALEPRMPGFDSWLQHGNRRQLLELLCLCFLVPKMRVAVTMTSEGSDGLYRDCVRKCTVACKRGSVSPIFLPSPPGCPTLRITLSAHFQTSCSFWEVPGSLVSLPLHAQLPGGSDLSLINLITSESSQNSRWWSPPLGEPWSHVLALCARSNLRLPSSKTS